MNVKIPCPLCKHPLSVKDPKPGKYKPKCTACSQPFALIIDDSTPPKIKVGKLATSDKAPAPVAEKPAPPPPKPKPEPSIEASSISRSAISGFDETIAPESNALTEKSELNATIDQPGGETGGFDKTLDSIPSSEAISKSSSQPHGANKTARAEHTQKVDPMSATQDSELSGSSLNASSSSSAKPKGDAPTAATASVNRLGGYRIIKELGAGGMGSVYLARQLSLDRPCALKTIQAHWASNPRVIARFIREAYAAAQLTHHNVVQIYDLGQESGTNFFSMELVGGGSLDDQLKSKGKLPPKLAATLILQASRGLKFAHDHGMVHRDIKPANLMMTSDGLVKVADMGLVKTPSYEETAGAPPDESDVQNLMLASARSQVTMEGSSMGTPAYMSPEQATDAANVDKRADIYSLGCTFYALLTGRPPFGGNTMIEVITKHRTEKIVRPERVISGLPSVLGDIIEKMTEKSPDDRYQDLEEVIHDLEVYLELREDSAGAQVIHHPADRSETDAAPSKSHADDIATRVTQVQADVPAEIAGPIRVESQRFSKSPLLLARALAPLAWIGICGLLAISTLLLTIGSGVSLLSESAKNLASQASAALGQKTETPNSPANPNNESSAPQGTGTASTPSRTSELLALTVSRLHAILGYVLALLIAPVAAIGFAATEGKSPLALRWRESFIAGGWTEWLFWGFSAIVTLLVVYFLGLWVAVILALVFGVGAGAAYYYGLEKPIASIRQPILSQTQVLLKQLRLNGLDEERVRIAVADHSGGNWEEFFENLFGYDAMRSMRTRMLQSKKPGLKQFRPIRDRWIDSWNQRVEEIRRAKEERTLEKSEQADLIASGVSAAEARKRAATMAATMVDAANETRQSMSDIAAGKLTDEAADAKRQRIKQMLAEARTGKLSTRELRDRSVDRIMGQLLGSKFRFACASLLLLGTGLWVQSNRTALEVYWQKARSTAQSTLDSLKNTTLDSQGLANASQAISTATEQAKTTLAENAPVQWTSVGGGLVHEKNILFIGLAGLFMLWGALLSGWRISLLLVPIMVVTCLLPKFLF